MDSVLDNLHDVAGVRVICSFIDDIYKIAAILGAQDDVTVLEIKDYIKNPKPNGYRSYHMIVEIPVFFSDRKQPMKVEVQIRTCLLYTSAKEDGRIIDATLGRRTKAVLVMDDGHVVLSALQPETLARRFSSDGDYEGKEEEE